MPSLTGLMAGDPSTAPTTIGIATKRLHLLINTTKASPAVATAWDALPRSRSAAARLI